MQIVREKRRVFGLAAACIFFIFGLTLDQVVKYIIRAKGGFYICNTGVSFGIRLDSYLIAIVFIAVVLAFFCSKSYKFQDKKCNIQTKSNNILSRKRGSWILNFENLDFFGQLYLVSWVLILSGALSNIIDRIFYSCVIDYIDLGFWPIFNLADVMICAGGFAVAYLIFRGSA